MDGWMENVVKVRRFVDTFLRKIHLYVVIQKTITAETSYNRELSPELVNR
jgi:hypothetical protein